MSTRDRILDAAAEVMTERGIAATTTRAIAAAAACSEALLYKYFDDKQQIFLAVLMERMPAVESQPTAAALTVREGLVDLVEGMIGFFVQSFPMAVSIFGSPGLLAEHRDAVRKRGFGPEGAIRIAVAQLERLRAEGRIRPDADLEAASSMLVGFAFHQAFLALFDGRATAPADAAPRAVETVLPYLLEARDDA